MNANSTRAASRKSRVYVFRDFLMRTYNLQPGTIVLDVAGGKGDLSWLLQNVDGVNSVVMDPRITKNHIPKSVDYLRAHPEEAKRRAVPGLPTHQPLATLLPKLEGKEQFASPLHLRVLVNDELVQAVWSVVNGDCNSAASSWTTFWNAAMASGRTAQPLGYQETVTDDYEGAITDPKQALDFLRNAELIVGFHPDQATDACLDLAQLLQIPFCVVPCCVFPDEFRHRQIRDESGTTRVRTYAQLLEYLQQQKCPTARRTELEFHFSETSKNIALYTLPPSLLGDDEEENVQSSAPTASQS